MRTALHILIATGEFIASLIGYSLLCLALIVHWLASVMQLAGMLMLPPVEVVIVEAKQ